MMPGKKSAQIVIIIILIIALGFTSTAAYAYWTDVKTYSNVVLEFEGEDANLVIEQQSEAFTGMLVPEGHANFTGEVEEVVFVYEVSVDKELAKTMNLIVEAIDVTIDGVVDYEHLVEITIGNGDRYFVNELFNSVVTITITVRLLEPIDAAEAVERGLSEELVNVEDSEAAFNAIKGKTINFTISFRVETRV
jgi:predicted ribosomally synthesized peptide with SipW-like signal peptide